METERHIHLIGIGGAGLSAIATVLLESGYTVSGSDEQSTVFTERLQQSGARVYIGHQEHNLAGAKMVLASSEQTHPASSPTERMSRTDSMERNSAPQASAVGDRRVAKQWPATWDLLAGSILHRHQECFLVPDSIAAVRIKDNLRLMEAQWT